MKNYHVKKGDKVKVISGDAKGKEGEIAAVLHKTDRVVIRFPEAIREELKLGKRTVRKNTPEGKQNGGQVDREYSTHVSNVAKVEVKAK